MSLFVENPVHFAADCACHGGRCEVVRGNFLFLDDGKEIAAVDWLQNKCGHVAIITGAAADGNAKLYHTSCQRMTDVVQQIFAGCLGAAERLTHSAAEMTVGELHRRGVTISLDACRARVDGFNFDAAP